LHATLLSTQKEGVWEYALHIKGTSVITIQHDCLLTEDFVGTTSQARKTVRRAQCGDIPQKFKAPVLCLGVVRFDTWMSGLVLGLAGHDPGCWNRLGTFAAGTDVFLRASEEEIQIA
jgi:hypothetical protein